MIPAETGLIFLIQTKVSQKEEIWAFATGINDIAVQHGLGDSYFQNHARFPLAEIRKKWEEADYLIADIVDQESASRLYDQAYESLIDAEEILIDFIKKESERLLVMLQESLRSDLSKCSYLKVFEDPTEAWREYNSYKSKLDRNYFIERIIEIDPSTPGGREDVFQSLETEARTIFEIRDLVVPVSAQTRYKIIGGAIVAVLTLALGGLTFLQQGFPGTWNDIFGALERTLEAVTPQTGRS